MIWVEFPGVIQTKRRPAVIVSTAAYHAVRSDIIVGLITSQTSKATAPTDHLIEDWKGAGLRVPSAFRAFVVTLPKVSVNGTMGMLAPADWKAVVNCLKVAIELT